jgi:hypothetical protein
MAKRRPNKIYAVENPTADVAPPHLAALMVHDAGKGVATEAGEVLWTGELTTEEWDWHLRAALTVEALSQLLRPIIESHRVVDPRSKNRRKKPLETYRLEQSLKLLIGHRPPKGRPGEVPEAELAAAINLYMRSALGFLDAPTSLRAVAHEAAGVSDDPMLTEKDKDDRARPVRDALLADKVRYLVLATAEGLPEVDEQWELVRQALSVLERLGLTQGPAV